MTFEKDKVYIYLDPYNNTYFKLFYVSKNGKDYTFNCQRMNNLHHKYIIHSGIVTLSENVVLNIKPYTTSSLLIDEVLNKNI